MLRHPEALLQPLHVPFYMLDGKCKSIEDVGELLKWIFKSTFEGMLETELTEHL
jgi:hypothetical protein